MDVKSLKANLYQDAASATETKATDATVAKKPVAITAVVSDVAAPKASASTIKSAKSEFQLAASAQQARLSNQLDQQVSDKTELVAYRKPVIRDNVPDYNFFGKRFDGFNALNHPEVLSTGSGDDKVDIQMGKDGRIHVNVNGTESWSGTPEQFKRLTIDTGAGRDTVTNSVNGANIVTGEGLDTVHNKASHTNINTGTEKDIIYAEGDYNVIDAGSGDDEILTKGDHDWIQGREGNDKITVNGSDNAIGGGEHIDTINVFGNRNSANGDEGDDQIYAVGDYNSINGGVDHDHVTTAGNRNTILTEEGNDRIEVSGNDNTIDAGANDDQVNVQGDRNTVDGGADRDHVNLAGEDNTFTAQDYIEKKENQFLDLLK